MVGNVSYALGIYGTKQRLYRLYTVQCSFYMSLQGGGGLARVEIGGVAAFLRPGQDFVRQHWGVRSAEGGRIQLGGRGVKYVEIFGGVKDFRVIENVKVEEEGGGVVGDDVRRARRLGKVGAADDL